MNGPLELLDDEPPAAPAALPSRHEAVSALMLHVAATSTGSRRFQFTVSDPREWVADLMFRSTGRFLAPDATWVRFFDPIARKGLLAALNGVTIDGEADLLLIAEPGVIERGLLRDLCRWAFFGAFATRVVARVPKHLPDLSDLLRRAGFDHDGTARDFYGAGIDAAVWSMSSQRCRWLDAAPECPAADAASLVSLRVH